MRDSFLLLIWPYGRIGSLNLAVMSFNLTTIILIDRILFHPDMLLV